MIGRVKKLYEDEGLTLREFADEIGVGESTIRVAEYRFKKGEAQAYSNKVLSKIFDAFPEWSKEYVIDGVERKWRGESVVDDVLNMSDGVYYCGQGELYSAGTIVFMHEIAGLFLEPHKPYVFELNDKVTSVLGFFLKRLGEDTEIEVANKEKITITKEQIFKIFKVLGLFKKV